MWFCVTCVYLRGCVEGFLAKTNACVCLFVLLLLRLFNLIYATMNKMKSTKTSIHANHAHRIKDMSDICT